MSKQASRQYINGNAAFEMVRFVVKWAPFGGGDEDILPTFGVLPTVFHARVAGLLRSDPSLATGHDVEQLITYCDRKSGWRPQVSSPAG
ncbi:hypothetical protein DFR67_12351 [Williamsia limnetica]|uniref:DUF3263 domain-containing protein n=1 Tax=Williamsia limnetica TaxID=882452 RepID=A0A318RCE7_WILLI|nr:hypothetical protein [Williamsia limnetica]PYE12326.1 hypothetical protein DFR67_12351 [Williamsia limnetica]